jgi:hypothetical protein
LTVRGRSASLRPTSPTSSRSRVRRIRRAPSSPRASSLLAGEDAIFSNIINYSIAVRRVTVAGVGNSAKFQPEADEIRFSFRFETLKAMLRGRRSSAAFANCRAVASCRSL